MTTSGEMISPSIEAKRIAIWGFCCTEEAMIVRELQKDSRLDIVTWIGIDEDCTYNVYDFVAFNKHDYNYKTPNVTQAMYDAVYPCLSLFMDMYSRHNRDSKARPLKMYDFHDYIHVFNRFIYLCADILVSNRVECLVLASIPHEGLDIILYKIAKFLNIPTLMFYQTNFPHRYMYCWEMGEFKHYLSAPPKPNHTPFKLEKREKLFYMTDSNYLTLNRKFDTKVLWDIITDQFFDKLFKGEYFELLERARYVIKYLDYQKYLKNYDSLLEKSTTLQKPFVYFPMHYQPEMTTVGLGGVYSDQALALEQLSKLIPEDWVIYTKDHFIQSEYMRSDWFFMRLKAIKNLKFLPIETNTFDLIDQCEFVSTITGTVGWEAIKNGKNALIFGKPWYQGLPGIFQYKEGIKLDDILNHQVDITDVEQVANQYVAAMEDGLIESAFIPNSPGFDSVVNAQKVARNIAHLVLYQESFQGEDHPTETLALV
ncbi:MAG: capsular biosynthesis protein [Cyanobacteria bacterium]|nr:capsular biosynthesis protein [Cyanobacteriota bacterium]